MAPQNHISTLVSIIIPAYNAADFIEETLASVIGQSYENIELIVVDDGSNDNTRAVVESFGNKVTYIYQSNSGGCSSPRNNGFRHSRGDFLRFFDADDLMLPNNIKEKVASCSVTLTLEWSVLIITIFELFQGRWRLPQVIFRHVRFLRTNYTPSLLEPHCVWLEMKLRR